VPIRCNWLQARKILDYFQHNVFNWLQARKILDYFQHNVFCSRFSAKETINKYLINTIDLQLKNLSYNIFKLLKLTY